MRFNLTTKSGEVISKCKAVSMDYAIEFFALRKKMTKADLLKIFDVLME